MFLIKKSKEQENNAFSIDRPEVSLVHNNELNENFYELVKDTLKEGAYNVRAMVRCIEQNKKLAGKTEL